MASPEYRFLTSRSALNRVNGMPFRWSLNPYRGCAHACHYCYARASHRYFDLDVGLDFENIIYVKTNVAATLKHDLNAPSWHHESIAIGTATDPYQPAEAKFRLTRACLEVLVDEANSASITTKGTLIVRDLDVLATLAKLNCLSVNVSLITLDEELCRRVEPGTPPPRSRLRVIERLSAAGIPTRVFLMPVLPGLTDRPDQLDAVVKAAAEHGAGGVIAAPLRLQTDVRDWYFKFIERDFPRLLATHHRGFDHGAEAPVPWKTRIKRHVEDAIATTEFQTPPQLPETRRVGRQFLLPLGP